MVLIISLFFAVPLGLIPAFIAGGKGRSFFLWWLYGAALFLIAFIHALVLKPDQAIIDRQAQESGMRKCPSCAEFIRREAKICRHCNRDVPALT